MYSPIIRRRHGTVGRIRTLMSWVTTSRPTFERPQCIGLGDRIRTCMTLLPGQVGFLIATTPRYWHGRLESNQRRRRFGDGLSSQRYPSALTPSDLYSAAEAPCGAVLVPAEGVEPSTARLRGECCIHMSLAGIWYRPRDSNPDRSA